MQSRVYREYIRRKEEASQAPIHAKTAHARALGPEWLVPMKLPKGCLVPLNLVSKVVSKVSQT